MAESLNFTGTPVSVIEKAFRSFERAPVTSIHEARRWKMDNSTVTLYKSGKLTIQGKGEGVIKAEILRLLHKEEGNVFGMDEAGRGEREGPLVIAGVLGNPSQLREGRDSKKISNKGKAFRHVTRNSWMQSVVSLNPPMIDALRTKGMTLDEIQGQVMDAFAALVQKLDPAAPLRADGKTPPGSGKKITFIVKGDDKDPVIGAASIVAKQQRTLSGNSDPRKTWKNYRK